MKDLGTGVSLVSYYDLVAVAQYSSVVDPAQEHVFNLD